MAMFEIALPNFLLFSQRKSSTIIGIIMSASFFTYLFATIFLKKVPEKLGIRKSLIISTSVSFIALFIQLLFFNDWVLIISRGINGLSLLLFWAPVQYQISDWANHVTEKESKRHFKLFSISWNVGLFAGYGSGLLIAFIFDNNFLILILAAIPLFLSIPVAFKLEKNMDALKQNKVDSIKIISASIPLEPKKHEDHIFPALFFTFFIFVISSFKGTFNFIYPFFLDYYNQPSYFYFIIIIIQQIPQAIIISYVAGKNHRIRLEVFLISLICAIVISIILMFYYPMWLVSLVMIIVGAVYGALYAITTNTMIDYGSSGKSTKYAMIYETYVSLGFWIAPTISGFLIGWKIQGAYLFQIIVGISAIVVLLKLRPAIKEKIKNLEN